MNRPKKEVSDRISVNSDVRKEVFDSIPVNPNATEGARNLLKYLAEGCGERLITGQHTQTNAMEEREYIKKVTGHYPKLVEFEMLSCSPNINYQDASKECITEVNENKNTLITALSLAKEGEIIPMICFHWFSPIGGRDKSFYSKNTDFDPEKILEKESPERKAFYDDLEVIARELEQFNKENIPVLFRPLHEAEGTWFWWGRKGGVVAAGLYKMLFRFFVDEKHLNNLLWVWSTPTKEAYPGDEYVDIIGWDIYLSEKKKTDYREQYDELRQNTTARKVAALTEVGYNPDIQMLEQSRVPWAFYMTWSKEFVLDEKYNSKEELRKLYDSDYTISL
ncbi:MAG: glycosyl hydrolase [Lachnospiraceae bacterium]